MTTKPLYSRKFTTVTIERSDVTGVLPTTVELIDEGGGYFFEVYQEKRSEALRLDPEEIDEVALACKALLNQLPN